MKRVILAITVVLALAGCDDVTKGEVIDRDHKNASIRIVQCGKVVCSVPEPERWRLRVQDGNRDRWIRVTQEQHDLCYVGSRWPECGE